MLRYALAVLPRQSLTFAAPIGQDRLAGNPKEVTSSCSDNRWIRASASRLRAC